MQHSQLAVLFEEESEEEENDLDDEFVVVAASVAVFRRKRVCTEDYFRTTVPRLVVEDFRSHFRLSRGTVELIVEQLGTLPGFVQAGDCPGRERVPVEKQLLVAIWLLGNQMRNIPDPVRLRSLRSCALHYSCDFQESVQCSVQRTALPCQRSDV